MEWVKQGRRSYTKLKNSKPPAKAGSLELWAEVWICVDWMMRIVSDSPGIAWSSFLSSDLLSRRNTLAPQNAFPGTSSSDEEVLQTGGSMFVLLSVSWSRSELFLAENSPVYAHDHYSLHLVQFWFQTLRMSDEPTLKHVPPPLLSKFRIDTSLPIQVSIQSGKPYDFHIHNICRTSCVAYSRS